MEKLIKEAVKALAENTGFNEIILNDGLNVVHLVRYTPSPILSYPVNYQWGYNAYQPSPQL